MDSKIHRFKKRKMKFFSLTQISSSLFLYWASLDDAQNILEPFHLVLQAPYPTARKWHPPYLSFSLGISICNRRDVRPFSFFTKMLTLSDGGYSMRT